MWPWLWSPRCCRVGTRGGGSTLLEKTSNYFENTEILLRKFKITGLDDGEGTFQKYYIEKYKYVIMYNEIKINENIDITIMNLTKLSVKITVTLKM